MNSFNLNWPRRGLLQLNPHGGFLSVLASLRDMAAPRQFVRLRRMRVRARLASQGGLIFMQNRT
jgi:hypothetical protein